MARDHCRDREPTLHAQAAALDEVHLDVNHEQRVSHAYTGRDGLRDSSGRAHPVWQVRRRLQRRPRHEPRSPCDPPGRDGSRHPAGGAGVRRWRTGRRADRPPAAKVSGKKTTPYGSWASPINPDLLLNGTVHMRNQMLRWDGDDLYWSELRPYEAGRIVVCRRAADGTIADVTPQGFNARSRVHEYGGGHYAVKGGTVLFTNFKDQRLYRQDRDGAPRAITPEADIRHADMIIDTERNLVFAVREDHTTRTPEPVNTIVALDADGKRGPITIASGNDFYSSPKLSPDGKRLAWQTWNHPNMPWDESEIWVGELDRDGNVLSSRKIAGGRNESVLQPEWSPSGELYFVSDRNDWWNLYRARGEGDEPVSRRAAEFGAPQWAFGQRFYALRGEKAEEIGCIYSDAGGARLGRIDLDTGQLRHIELFYSTLCNVQGSANKSSIYAGSSTLADRVLVIDLETLAQEVVKVSNPAHIESG